MNYSGSPNSISKKQVRAIDILNIYIKDGEFGVKIHWILWAILGAMVTCRIFFHRRRLSQDFEISEAELGIGSGKIKIKPNYEDVQIAYMIWVELNTRKIGLEIDFEHDVINEVYNSWYEFFRITREHIKSIPVTKIIRDKSTRDLVKMASDVLNKELRTHLTLWQAKFGKWYKEELQKDENKALSPQEIQIKFQDYDLLITNMREVNLHLINYKKFLQKMVLNDKCEEVS